MTNNPPVETAKTDATEDPKSCWRTPRWLFELLDAEFHFTFDAAAGAGNALCANFLIRRRNALKRNWNWAGKIVFCNPPHGERNLKEWIATARRAAKQGATWVMILPSDTTTQWWLSLCKQANEIRLLNPRIPFDPVPGLEESSPKGGTSVSIFRPGPRVPGPAYIKPWDVREYMPAKPKRRRMKG